MNWSKAKTILIVTFLVLNIYLVSQVIMQSDTSISISEYQAVNERTLKLLRDKYDIDISVEKLDKGVSPNVNPEVVWKKVDVDNIVKSLWPAKAFFPDADGRYIQDNELLVTGERDYYYSNENRNKRLISQASLKIIKNDQYQVDFISGILTDDLEQALGIEFENWNLIKRSKEKLGDEVFYNFVFTQRIDLEVHDVNSYTRVKISENGSVVELKRSELRVKTNNKNFVDKIKDIISSMSSNEKTKKISASEALLFFAGQKPYEGSISVSKIKLVYSGLKESDLEQSENTPFEWYLTPVWKIDTIDENNIHESYFLNAYTGRLER